MGRKLPTKVRCQKLVDISHKYTDEENQLTINDITITLIKSLMMILKWEVKVYWMILRRFPLVNFM
jgi:hypothetical protein